MYLPLIAYFSQVSEAISVKITKSSAHLIHSAPIVTTISSDNFIVAVVVALKYDTITNNDVESTLGYAMHFTSAEISFDMQTTIAV